MSELEELINELCPNGVVQKKLKDIAFLKRGMPLTKSKAVSGDIPVISGGKEPAFYCNTFNRYGENITIAGSGAGAGYVQYWDVPIFASDCFTITGLKTIETKFLYYFMSSIQDKIYSTKKGGGVPHVHISDVENFNVPVPPLKIQHEIIRILDNFIELTEELTEELTVRKKQYEYYRDKLLTFSDTVEYKYLHEITLKKIVDGMHNLPQHFSTGYAPILSALNIADGKIKLDSTKFVTKEVFEKENMRTSITVGDVLLTIVATLGRSAVVTDDIKVLLQRSVAVIKPNPLIILSKYLKYYLDTSLVQKYISENAHGAAQKGFYIKQLEKLLIPLPSLDEQQKIIDILDNFNYLSLDITTGILTEIEWRKKQYEYYRDKLLSFEVKCHD